MSPENIKLLKKLDREYRQVRKLRRSSYMREILNLDSEREKFLEAVARGDKYNPVFRHHPQSYDSNGLVEKAEALRDKFERLDCFLSKYYLECLDFLIQLAKVKKMNFNTEAYGQAMLDLYGGRVDPSLVQEAERLIAENPYVKVETSILTGDLEEQEYLAGYLLVAKMTDAELDEILKYNIGPDQFAELDQIKAFLSINGFL